MMDDMKKILVTSLEDGRVLFEIGSKTFILSEVEAEYLCEKLETELYDNPSYRELELKVLGLEAELDVYKHEKGEK